MLFVIRWVVLGEWIMNVVYNQVGSIR